MMFQPTLVPAYGADYKSKKEVIAALDAGKDFLCEPHGSYINLAGIVEAKLCNVTVRYKRLSQCMVFNIVNGKVKDGYK